MLNAQKVCEFPQYDWVTGGRTLGWTPACKSSSGCAGRSGGLPCGERLHRGQVKPVSSIREGYGHGKSFFIL